MPLNTPYPVEKNTFNISDEDDDFPTRNLNESSPLTQSTKRYMKQDFANSVTSLPSLPPKPSHLQPQNRPQHQQQQQQQQYPYGNLSAKQLNKHKQMFENSVPETNKKDYLGNTTTVRELPPIPDNEKLQSKNPFSDSRYASRDYDDVDLPPSPPHSDPFRNDEISDDDSHSDLKHKMKRNEKNRIRSLRRKPRFHYTKLPYFTMVISLIQIIVFIVELAKMAHLTGSAFQTKPYFNPMLGPLTFLLINMGARYVPCMHQIKDITDDTSILFPCANSTSVDTYVCSLSELCGLTKLKLNSDGSAYLPDQWYRIFIPIFLHAGFLHIIFNLLLQVTMGSSIERNIGIIKYAIIYISSGIGGFLLGANFTPQGIASTGALGALFGIVATNIILFIYTGKKNTNMYGTKHYALFICIMIGEIVISLVLGLLPGLDNFSHIGGFAMGILSSIVVLKDPFWVFVDGIITYPKNPSTWQQFLNNWNPMYSIEDKIRSRFFIWCGVRIIALILMIIYLVLLCKNFFNNDINRGNNCKWCKYFNCIPVKGWCDIGQVSVTSTTTTSDSNSNSNSNSNPTTTASSSSSSVPTTRYSTMTYTTSMPSSVENPKSNTNSEGTNGGLRKRFASSFTGGNSGGTANIAARAGGDIQQQYGIGSGLYVIVIFFTISFLKKKKII